MASINFKGSTGKSGKGTGDKKESIKEKGGVVKKSSTGKSGGQTTAPKGSTEGLKGGNAKVKRKGQAGH